MSALRHFGQRVFDDCYPSPSCNFQRKNYTFNPRGEFVVKLKKRSILYFIQTIYKEIEYARGKSNAGGGFAFYVFRYFALAIFW